MPAASPVGAPAGARDRFSPPVVSVLLVFAVAVIAAGFRDRWNLVDDALILCRYAENAARGAGWVFNRGERIEAHSSPLWVFLLSVGGRLGMELPYLSRALGVVFGGAAAALAFRVLRRRTSAMLAFAFGVAIAGDPGLATWSVSGLETPAFLFLVLASVVSLIDLVSGSGDGSSEAAPGSGPRAHSGTASERGTALAWRLGSLLALLPFTRPEGAPAGALIAGLALLTASRERRGRLLVPVVLPFLAAAVALTAWRVSYYGSPVPETVVAKWTPRVDAVLHGARQLLLFLARRLPLVVLAILAIVRSRRRDAGPEEKTEVKVLAAAIVFFLLEVLAAGGDWMGMDRLPAPGLALGALLAARGSGTLPAGKRWIAAVLAIVSTGTAWLGADVIPGHGRAARDVGEWLREREPDTALLGVAAAGAIPFYSGLETVDVLGITDPVVARTPPSPAAPWKPGHMRYDITRFLARDPDVIVWEFGTSWCEAQLREPARAPDHGGDYRRELLLSPEFRSRYHLVAGAPPGTGRYFTVFRADSGRQPRPDR